MGRATGTDPSGGASSSRGSPTWVITKAAVSRSATEGACAAGVDGTATRSESEAASGLGPAGAAVREQGDDERDERHRARCTQPHLLRRHGAEPTSPAEAHGMARSPAGRTRSQRNP